MYTFIILNVNRKGRKELISSVCLLLVCLGGGGGGGGGEEEVD